MPYQAIAGHTLPYHFPFSIKPTHKLIIFWPLPATFFATLGSILVLFVSFRFLSFCGLFFILPIPVRSFGNYYVAICRYVVGDTCPLSPKSAPSRTSTSCLAVYALPLRAKLKCLPWARVGVEVQVQFEPGEGGGCLKSLKSHRIASHLAVAVSSSSRCPI